MVYFAAITKTGNATNIRKKIKNVIYEDSNNQRVRIATGTAYWLQESCGESSWS